MKEQKYILKNCNSFEPVHIFDCGQCFRWNKCDDNSYIGVIKGAVIRVKEEKGKFIFCGKTEKGSAGNCNSGFEADKKRTDKKQSLSACPFLYSLWQLSYFLLFN